MVTFGIQHVFICIWNVIRRSSVKLNFWQKTQCFKSISGYLTQHISSYWISAAKCSLLRFDQKCLRNLERYLRKFFEFIFQTAKIIYLIMECSLFVFSSRMLSDTFVFLHIKNRYQYPSRLQSKNGYIHSLITAVKDIATISAFCKKSFGL